MKYITVSEYKKYKIEKYVSKIENFVRNTDMYQKCKKTFIKIQKYVRNTKMYHKYKSVIEIHILY